MKFNQTDLIAIIAAAVVSIGACIAFLLMKPLPKTVPAVTEVPLSAPALPAPNVAYATSLGGGGGGGGRGRMGGGGMGFGGPPPGMGGPPPGMGMAGHGGGAGMGAATGRKRGPKIGTPSSAKMPG